MNVFRFEFLSMTTPCVLLLQHTQESVANEVAKAIYQQTLALEKKYNFFSADSWLTQHVNERHSASVTVDDEAIQVLTVVRQMSELTQGIFDITVGTIKTHDHINDGKRANQIRKQNTLNREALCESYTDAMGLQAWQLDEAHNKLIFNHEMTRLDLGGVIKEYAVDKATDIAKAKGCSGMISFGGDLRVIGLKVNGEPYKIGIKDPFDPQKSCMSLPVVDEALTTSGAYERQEVIAGKKYHHIINTKKIDKLNTNELNKTNAEIVSATVVSKTALASGILATALMQDKNIDLPENCKVILIDANAEVSARKS